MAKTTFNVQDQYLNQVRKERVRVIVTMMSGEKVEGYLKSFDSFCLLIESGSDILLYKHAIFTVTSIDGTFRPSGGRGLPAGFSAEDKRVSLRKMHIRGDHRLF